jgi:hypothetical protein
MLVCTPLKSLWSHDEINVLSNTGVPETDSEFATPERNDFFRSLSSSGRPFGFTTKVRRMNNADSNARRN